MTARILRLALELALTAFTLALLATVLLARGVPLTGRHLFVVGGASMEPALHLGSAVIVEPVSAASLAVGDVVSIEVGPEHAIFTHRISRLVNRPDGLWIETKGDANETADPSIIPATSVIGRVQMAIPSLGYVVAALSQPTGIGIALGLAGLLVALILLLDGSAQSRPSTVPSAPHGAPVPRLVPALDLSGRPTSWVAMGNARRARGRPALRA